MDRFSDKVIRLVKVLVWQITDDSANLPNFPAIQYVTTHWSLSFSRSICPPLGSANTSSVSVLSWGAINGVSVLVCSSCVAVFNVRGMENGVDYQL